MDHNDKQSIPRRQAKSSKKEPVKLSKEQLKELDAIIRTSQLQYREQIEKEREKHNQFDMDKLDNLLSEYLGSYILIGYNLNNESVEMSSCNNQMEASALTDHFKKAFLERTSRYGSEMF
jgi:hypothetical protein